MTNINNFSLKKGENTWQTLITSIFKQYDIPYSNEDYIYMPSAEVAWNQANKDIDKSVKKSEEKIRLKKELLEVMIQYIKDEPETEKIRKNKDWKIKNNNNIFVSPEEHLLELNVKYLKSFKTSVNPVSSLKTKLQDMVGKIVDKQEEEIRNNNDNLKDINNLVDTLKVNLEKIKTTSTQSINLNNLRSVLEKAIDRISENAQTGVQNSSDVNSINNLVKTLNSDLNTIKSTPVARNELLELKKVEAQLRLFKKKLSEFLVTINNKNSENEKDIISANKNIVKLESELKDLVSVFSQKGGELKLDTLDPNNILEKKKNELIPKGKYTKDLLNKDNFILNCSGHKWSICDEFENVKDPKKKMDKSKIKYAMD